MLKQKETTIGNNKTSMLKKCLGTGLVWIWVAALLIFLDRLSKIWALENLSLFEPQPILPIFNFTLAYNTGAAFSFLHNASGWQNLFLGGLALSIAVFILVWLAKIPARERWVSISLSLILGGALGNAWDRVLYGFVIDFLDFHLGQWHFAIFNIADSAISIGAAMLFLNWVFFPKNKTGTI